MERVKKTAAKVLKRVGIVATVILSLALILIISLYAFNQISLKKESGLISHKGEYVEVDGRRMNLLIEGSGEKTLVLMSGYGTPSPILDFKPLTDRLKDHYRVVVIEKFGYGYSDDIESDRSVDIMTRQDREALLKAGIEGPYILCPHSASGLEAMYWALHYPDEVVAIIGLDMAVPGQYDYMGIDFDKEKPQSPSDFEKENSSYCFWIYRVGLMRLMKAEDIFSSLKSEYLTEEEKEEYKAIGYTRYAAGTDSTIMREQIKTEGLIRTLKELHDGPVPNIPTFFYVTDDPMMEMQYGSIDNWRQAHRDYLKGVTNGKMKELHVGHYLHTEIPEQLAADMKAFIDSLE